MPYGKAGLKSAGKWARVIKLLRENEALKTAIAQDVFIGQELDNMNVVLVDEAEKAGVDGQDVAPDLKTLDGLLPLRVWQGRLVYSKKPAGWTKSLTPNQKNFRHYAFNLRKRYDEIIRAMSMLVDAGNVLDEGYANPGGIAGDGEQ